MREILVQKRHQRQREETDLEVWQTPSEAATDRLRPEVNVDGDDIDQLLGEIAILLDDLDDEDVPPEDEQ